MIVGARMRSGTGYDRSGKVRMITGVCVMPKLDCEGSRQVRMVIV